MTAVTDTETNIGISMIFHVYTVSHNNASYVCMFTTPRGTGNTHYKIWAEGTMKDVVHDQPVKLCIRDRLEDVAIRLVEENVG